MNPYNTILDGENISQNSCVGVLCLNDNTSSPSIRLTVEGVSIQRGKGRVAISAWTGSGSITLTTNIVTNNGNGGIDAESYSGIIMVTDNVISRNAGEGVFVGLS